VIIILLLLLKEDFEACSSSIPYPFDFFPPKSSPLLAFCAVPSSFSLSLSSLFFSVLFSHPFCVSLSLCCIKSSCLLQLLLFSFTTIHKTHSFLHYPSIFILSACLRLTGKLIRCECYCSIRVFYLNF